MPMGIDIGAGGGTLATTERTRGRVGPTPEEGRVEIRWGSLDGDEVVAKAAGGGLADRLRREAEVLRRVGGAPAVSLAELVEGPDHTELVTERFGSLTLAESGLLDPWECGTALVQLCDAVAALHDAGWTHGDLDGSHVLVDPGQGVRLCSFADASGTDPAHGPTAVAADRDALAFVVTDVLERPPGFDSRRGRRRWSRAAARASRRLASSRGLLRPAQVLAALVEAGLPGTRGEPHVESDRVPGALRTWLLVLGASVAVVAAAIAWPRKDEPAATAVGATSRAEPEPLCAEVEAGTGCRPASADGQVIEVDGRRFEVGEDGDVPQLGDWDCDGLATVAILRPSTGQVFAFDGWATGDGEIEADYVGTWKGAVDIVEPTSCGPATLEMEDGSTVELAATAEPIDAGDPDGGAS